MLDYFDTQLPEDEASEHHKVSQAHERAEEIKERERKAKLHRPMFCGGGMI